MRRSRRIATHCIAISSTSVAFLGSGTNIGTLDHRLHHKNSDIFHGVAGLLNASPPLHGYIMGTQVE
jgi:hypothetical protein